MSSTPSTRTRRAAACLVAGALTVLPLSACTFSSNSFSCDLDSCSVTLSGEGAEVEVLGTSLALGGIEDGRATLQVGSVGVSCAEGERVAAGQLSLECTSVDSDSVELTAGLG
jgi:hypothetical protein